MKNNKDDESEGKKTSSPFRKENKNKKKRRVSGVIPFF